MLYELGLKYEVLDVAVDEEEVRDEEGSTLGGTTLGVLVPRVDISAFLMGALRFFLRMVLSFLPGIVIEAR